MWRNYTKIAFRNLLKHKTVSFITISGLSLGIGITLLVLLYVTDQISYDDFHKKSDQIYRVLAISKEEGGLDQVNSYLFAPLAPLLENNVPEIENSVRFAKQREAIVKYGESVFLEENNLFTEPAFFEIFSFELLQGNSETALKYPFSIVLTPEMARRYFVDKNPIGEVLTFDNKYEYEVTGIIESPPANSSIQYDFLLSFSTQYETNQRMIQEYRGGWAMAAFETYLLLKSGSSIKQVEQEILPIIRTQTDTEFATNRSYELEPLSSVYMQTAANNNLGPSSDIRYVYIFSAAALLVLIISCFNYTNIATAQYLQRAKEVGIRKSAGANRSSLVKQFLGESVLLSLLSLAVALLLVELSLPYLNRLLDLSLDSSPIYSINIYSVAILVATVLTGLLSGLYPAFILSRFEITDIFRSSIKPEGGILVKRGLIVIQFALSAGILICALLIRQQLAYTSSKNLGLESSQVMIIPEKGGLDNKEAVTFRDLLKQHSGILSSSVSGGMVTKGTMGMSIEPESYEGEPPMTNVFAVDSHFLETLGMTIKEGRFFYDDIQQDAGKSLVINETLANKVGWKDSIGKSISVGGGEPREVIGVVNDFHFESLHNEIEPVLLIPYGDGFINYIAIKFDPRQTGNVIEFAQKQWDSVNEAYPFEYFFLDESFEQLYQAEKRMATIIDGVTILTVLIACMGLYGLVFYMVVRKRKEIGIRKVLGANMSSLIYLLCKNFMGSVILGLLIAIPTAWYLMRQWLADFSYRIDMGLGIFIYAGIAIVGIALITICIQAVRAALANPVESIRNE